MAYGYEITQEDIDGVVRWLKLSHPEYANEGVARIALEFNQDIVHDLGEADPELAERVAKGLKKQNATLATIDTFDITRSSHVSQSLKQRF